MRSYFLTVRSRAGIISADLNHEDTSLKSLCAFAIEKTSSRLGVCLGGRKARSPDLCGRTARSRTCLERGLWPYPNVCANAQTVRAEGMRTAMSQRNGDKSRFHRERKQNILRRKRTKELLRGAIVPDRLLVGKKADVSVRRGKEAAS